LVATAVGDRCVNCGAALSSDQRYCVVCGERRGAPRFSLPVAAPAVETTRATTSIRAGRSGGPRFGSGATLIAGVGTLLLALLVGFVIGNAASRNNTKTVTTGGTGVKVINVGGSGTGSSTGSARTPTTAFSPRSTKSSSHSHSHKAGAKPSAAARKNASAQTNAAQKVLGGRNTPPSNTKVGQKCSGSGCDRPGYNKKTKKFDGSFFGQ
ncbi:MAG: hypothetical protein ACRDK8_03475, partial [Solirubrobacteraceae bacterium]